VTGGPELAIPDRPRLGLALGEALFDFYFNSWRLVPANLIWGVLLLVVLGATAIWLPLAALTGLLAVPVAGIYRLSALIHRGASVGFSDVITGMRRFGGQALLLGVAATFLAAVFSANIAVGIQIGGIAGGVLSALAAYADLGLAIYLVAAWPIIVDPLREELTLRSRLRLAFLVIAARPGRMLLLTLVVIAVLIVSTVVFAVLVTVAVAYVSLVTTRYVLPAADRVEGRATVPRAS
jgi:uncharacterized membrane protein YesL